MYPVFRLLKSHWQGRRAAPLDLLGEHVSHHRCWPQDLDLFLEMNNGRILTIFDLGRTGLGARVGLMATLRREGWGLAVAGGSTRFRKRIRAFDRFVMRTRCVGWDERFMYIEQSIWMGRDCAAHVLLRTCVTDRAGIVPTARVLTALGAGARSPRLPDWVHSWIDADADRPWPPRSRPVLERSRAA